MCRNILDTCVRNTEEAEKFTLGRGGGKGVWGMIEDSELAKTFRQGDDLKVCMHSGTEITKEKKEI